MHGDCQRRRPVFGSLACGKKRGAESAATMCKPEIKLLPLHGKGSEWARQMMALPRGRVGAPNLGAAKGPGRRATSWRFQVAG